MEIENTNIEQQLLPLLLDFKKAILIAEDIVKKNLRNENISEESEANLIYAISENIVSRTPENEPTDYRFLINYPENNINVEKLNQIDISNIFEGLVRMLRKAGVHEGTITFKKGYTLKLFDETNHYQVFYKENILLSH